MGNLTLNPGYHSIKVQGFYLGTGGSLSKLRGGLGYPPHMRRIWQSGQRQAAVELDEDRDFPLGKQLSAEKVKGTVFDSAVVMMPDKRIVMYKVKIDRITFYYNEPVTLELVFDHFVSR